MNEMNEMGAYTYDEETKIVTHYRGAQFMILINSEATAVATYTYSNNMYSAVILDPGDLLDHQIIPIAKKAIQYVTHKSISSKKAE